MAKDASRAKLWYAFLVCIVFITFALLVVAITLVLTRSRRHSFRDYADGGWSESEECATEPVTPAPDAQPPPVKPPSDEQWPGCCDDDPMDWRNVARRRQRRRRVRFANDSTDVTNSRVFDVEEGDIRAQARHARRRKTQAMKGRHDVVDNPVPTSSKANEGAEGTPREAMELAGVPLDAFEPIKVVANNRHPVAAAFSLPRAILADGQQLSLLPENASMDVMDMAFTSRGPVFLLENTGDLLLKFDGQLTYLPCDRSVAQIVSCGHDKLLGRSDGVVFELDLSRELPNVAHWEEITSPTRQAIHLSASQDKKSIVIQDPWMLFMLDENLRVAGSNQTPNTRFMGTTREEFADVTPEGAMITSSGEHQRDVAKVAFVKPGTATPLTRNEYANGRRGLYVHNGELFCVSR